MSTSAEITQTRTAVVNRVLTDKAYGFAQTERGETIFIPPTLVDAHGITLDWVGRKITFTVAQEPRGFRALAIEGDQFDRVVSGMVDADKLQELLELLRQRRQTEDALEDLLDDLLDGEAA